jgi:hypothetical protein
LAPNIPTPCGRRPTSRRRSNARMKNLRC